ncbi:nuclear transport factor 2 family protein [Streptomyces pilosus]|uniref:nuclear transport factor 2 family protein n=1 Tax=Streptomyces pilosus TaxID=28893 RepID=UPI0036AA8CF5
MKQEAAGRVRRPRPESLDFRPGSTSNRSLRPAVHDETALNELLALFTADATVEIGPEPARGDKAVAALYRAHLADHAEMKHFWKTTVFDDGTLRAEWVCAARKTDGGLITVAGVEHATLDAQGLISHLHNEFTRLPG